MNIWSINHMNASLLQLQFWIRFENRQNESNSIRLKISNYTAINPNWNWRCLQRPGQKKVIWEQSIVQQIWTIGNSNMSNDRPNAFEQLHPFICSISIPLRNIFRPPSEWRSLDSTRDVCSDFVKRLVLLFFWNFNYDSLPRVITGYHGLPRVTTA